MSQPVKISDALILDARLMAKATQRSIAGQIEFWASVGRALEKLLRGHEIVALSQAGNAKPLSACVESAGSAIGRKSLDAYLKDLPYPHYKAAPGSPGLVIREEKDGSQLIGRFVNRKFQAVRRVKK